MDLINPVFNRHKQPDFEEVCFQVISWYAADYPVDEEADDIVDGEIKENLEYIIFASGVNKLGQSVTLKIKDFTPYFYVQVPDIYTSNDANLFFKYIKNRLWKNGYGLVRHRLIESEKIYGYQAGKKHKFIQLFFSTDTAFYKCKWFFTDKSQEEKPIKVPGVDNYTYEAFETNVNHITRFCHINDIKTAGWIKVVDFIEDLEVSNTQINITANWKKVLSDPDTSIAPLTIYSWDIETLPENTEEFPNPELKGDQICQISVVLIKYTTKIIQKFIFTNRPCSPMDNVVLFECKGEKELLKRYCDFFKCVDPDWVIGFNTWNFDDRYLWIRLQLYNLETECFSRITNADPKLIKKDLSSSAYGNNEFIYIQCPGRETFDLMVAIRREHKIEGYSLNIVSKHFLNEHKVDLPLRVMFKKLESGGPDEIAECADYCIQDSNLVARLILHLCMIPNYVEMAKATFVPIEWLLFRGQQCKVFSLIALEARKRKLIIPVSVKLAFRNFKGATVLTALRGLYYDPVAGLDFASLYPSIMIAYNMCYSTYIMDEETLKYVKENNIPYKTIEWDEENEDNNDTTKFSFSFIQCEDDDGNPLEKGFRGVLPSILLELWQGRKATKKLMKNEKDPFNLAVLNGKQLAQKVTMNSVYGFTGANNGILPCKPIAACVTATGRETIEKTSRMAGDKFGAMTVYGDSIFFDELITVIKEDVPTDISIGTFAESLDEEWEEYRGFKIGDITINNKECKDLQKSNYLTLTHEGYQKINRIIRHETKKKAYKITALDDKGILHSVTVTEGHSLIDQEGKMITAQDLKIGDLLWNYDGNML